MVARFKMTCPECQGEISTTADKVRLTPDSIGVVCQLCRSTVFRTADISYHVRLLDGGAPAPLTRRACDLFLMLLTQTDDLARVAAQEMAA